MEAVVKQARTTRHPWLVASDANLDAGDFRRGLWFKEEGFIARRFRKWTQRTQIRKLSIAVGYLFDPRLRFGLCFRFLSFLVKRFKLSRFPRVLCGDFRRGLWFKEDGLFMEAQEAGLSTCRSSGSKESSLRGLVIISLLARPCRAKSATWMWSGY